MFSNLFDSRAGPEPTAEDRRVLLIQGPDERERAENRGWLRRHHELCGRQGRADFRIAGQLNSGQRRGGTRAESFRRHFRRHEARYHRNSEKERYEVTEGDLLRVRGRLGRTQALG